MTDCMFDFRLNDDGQVELADIGEGTHDFIMEACYPKLDKAFATAEWDEAGLGYPSNLVLIQQPDFGMLWRGRRIGKGPVRHLECV